MTMTINCLPGRLWRRGLLWACLLLTSAFATWTASAQGALASGASGTDQISPAGEVDSWSVQVTAGATIVLRAGSPVLTPRIRLFGPDNVQLVESTWFNSATRDGVLSHRAAVAGTYTILVNAAYPAQTGAYTLHAAIAPAAVSVGAGDQGGDLVSGVANAAELTMGDLDVWGFTAQAGETLLVRMGAQTATPWIRVFQPDGAQIAESTWFNSATRDGAIAVTLTNAGPHIVVASAAYAGQSGAYTLHAARVPGSFTTSVGDQGGELVNGAATPGSLTVGDLDLWSFQGNAGDHVVLRMGGPELTPWIRLYAPDGTLVGQSEWFNAATRDGVLSVRLTASGTYAVVASAAYGSQDGAYTLHLARGPGTFQTSAGDEGGLLPNGAAVVGNLTLGDLDLFQFEAHAGERVELRMGGTNLTPLIEIYDPSGALAGRSTWFNAATRDGSVSTVATNAGTYLVVVQSVYSGQSGSYGLHGVRAPGAVTVSEGDEGGELANGVVNAGRITLGDLDAWQFPGVAGESVILRMAGPELTPWIRLYGPDGVEVAASTWFNAATRDGIIVTRLTQTGGYIVVAAAAYGGQTSDYTLHRATVPGDFDVSPGDEGGPLVNGITNLAALPLGDVDVWSFVGTPGDSNVFRVTGTGLTPSLLVFAPDGALLRQSAPFNAATRDATVNLPITNAGLYTVVMTAHYAGQFGTYQFKQSRVPPDLIHPEVVAVEEGATVDFTLSAQDPDEPGKPLQFNLLSAPSGMTLILLGATNAQVTWPTTEITGPSTNIVTATVTDVVNGRAFTRTNSFPVIVHEVNLPPVLTVPADLVMNEGENLATAASATDADVPANPLTFALAQAPEGMQIDATSGAITWRPTEAQGPGDYTIQVSVTDDSPSAVNARQLSVTNSFRVVVRELNVAPVLSVPPSVAIDELQTYTASATASDADLPANTLVFSLAEGPVGLVIDPATGALRWTPTEAQGPAAHTVRIVVTDSNPVAENARQISVTNSFQLTVREVNQRPVVLPLGDVSVDEGGLVSVNGSASDADLPANVLTYALIQAPSGATVSASGEIQWQTGEADGPSTNRLVLVATDNGVPALSVTNTLTVVVRELNTVPVLTVPSDQRVAENTTLAVAASATDADLPANVLTFRLASAPDGMTIDASSGALRWTPTEAQGPSTNLVVVVVADANPAAGGAASSVTNQFRVVVDEVNLVPVLASLADVSGHYGAEITVTATATDADLPAQRLTYALVTGPAGLTVDATTGRLAWTPPQSSVGEHAVTVKASDDGSPALSAEVTFKITVFGAGAQLSISRLAAGLIQISSTGEAGLDYELQASQDLVQWERLVDFRMTATPHVYIDPQSLSGGVRFYRLRLVNQ